MNKTDSYATGYFAFAQYDTSPPLVTLSTAKGLKLSYTKIFRSAQYDALSPRWALSLHASHTQRLFAYAQSDGVAGFACTQNASPHRHARNSEQ